jgi:hypothetical protein
MDRYTYKPVTSYHQLLESVHSHQTELRRYAEAERKARAAGNTRERPPRKHARPGPEYPVTIPAEASPGLLN